MHVEEVDGIELVERNVRRLLPGEKQGEAAKSDQRADGEDERVDAKPGDAPALQRADEGGEQAVRHIAGMMPIPPA